MEFNVYDLPVDWKKVERLDETERQYILWDFARIEVATLSREYWPKYRHSVATMPTRYLNDQIWSQFGMLRPRGTFCDFLLDQLWSFTDIQNGGFSRWGETPEKRETLMKRLTELASILDEKGVRSSCSDAMTVDDKKLSESTLTTDHWRNRPAKRLGYMHVVLIKSNIERSLRKPSASKVAMEKRGPNREGMEAQRYCHQKASGK